jgi:hypothetical protein|tara:strand:+ start:2383 stop:2697 length:315 start_codon:yes stop_codon:yes gene_type:complete
MNFLRLRGKRIKSIRGFRSKADKRIKYPSIEIQYILFDDKTTIMEFDEQDYYTYHDCSSSARHIIVRQDKIRWKRIFSNLKNYPVATRDFEGCDLKPKKKKRIK